ncbi:hypothetical protein AArcSl_2836 [Halalkaliarchaeum desulfuricum]|uniref:Uncharacterized protein n=1 Tax=Halalkaliarchaeum desulfuricum TaxID=2055893 RepID=A0A343TMX9_9EURY|nr:hypothetical protein AArcSl_2836 [Halalkaliarchaeum desulfuricum]
MADRPVNRYNNHMNRTNGDVNSERKRGLQSIRNTKTNFVIVQGLREFGPAWLWMIADHVDHPERRIHRHLQIHLHCLSAG